ncbi:MAG: hypothetical protein ACLQJ0_13445 [Steroidobacteraceae bacterium]|jgi:acetoin utilization deacetylase AcuC-like enzyme
MKCVYHPGYQAPLSPDHPFPMSKYPLLKDQLVAEGLAGNLAGGTHHAFADHGEGFCVLNDVAIAIMQLRAEGVIERAVVIDLDVHQGNGTAAIFEAIHDVFTFSMHGERNYPTAKMRSSLDVGLRDGVGDAEYLAILARHMPAVLEAAKADIAFYVAACLRIRRPHRPRG